ncbi:MAG: methyltransferase [Treponema sp.]|nr:methyltransferase [Treponema sp.]
MNLFYASFIPGLQNVAASVIKERLAPDVRILKLLDGAVLFETETGYDKLNFFCFNNIFAVINVMDEHGTADNERRSDNLAALEKHIKTIVNIKPHSHAKEKNIILKTQSNSVVYLNPLLNNSKSFNTFRVVFSDENKPASVNEKFRLDVERFISRISGLKVNRSLPDTEFWFLFRREDEKKQMADNVFQEENGRESKNFSVFMKRLTLHSSREKTLHRGELPPPLAWAMCRLGNLKHSDTVLDPFCGYGSIPETAFKHFHITEFIACDNNGEASGYTAARFKKREKHGLILHKNDFIDLPLLLGEKSVDAIITDPPWGHFKVNDDIFPVKMFDVFGKLLKDGGRAVVLYANENDFLKAVPCCFELQEKIPILLSGRKAVIYKFILRGSPAG